ncbi:MAG TPA: hypothetical protein VKT77_21820 [Chthonomonadaceae bacterium]|nr:hypothetical protein [Chthonomonadaceae bacterium]
MTAHKLARTMGQAGLALLLAGLGVQPAASQMAPPPILDPETVSSASGDYSLLVDPSNKLGAGGATYRLSRKGAVVWQGTRPFTLWTAAVTDEGIAAGYGYSNGPAGWGNKPGERGTFDIVIIDAAGQTRMDIRVKRTDPPVFDTWPYPQGATLTLDGPNDRMVVGVEEWDADRFVSRRWLYQISTGKETARYVAKPSDSIHLPDPETRDPFRHPDPNAPAVGREVRLALRDKVVLRAGGSTPESPVRNVSDLVNAGPGRLAFVRRDNDRDQTLVVISSHGVALQTASLAGIDHHADVAFSHLLWRGGNSFVVFAEKTTDDGQTRSEDAYGIDARTGTVARIPEAHFGWVDKAAALPDGSFAVLASPTADAIPRKGLYVFDANGKGKWSLPPDDGYDPDNHPERLFSPESVAILTTGQIAVLDVIRHTVQLYGGSGKYRGTISLDRAWGREANYPCDIFAAPGGEFVVHDFQGRPQLYRMRSTGKVLARLTPRYSGAQEFQPRAIAIGADGLIWVTDAYSIFKLDAAGRTTVRLGESPRPDQLRSIGELVVRPDGSFLARDGRSGAVHEFDVRGRWLRVCLPRGARRETPPPFDAPHQHIEIGPNGAFAVEGEWFGPDGRHVAAPNGFQPLDKRIARIDRRPDRTWIDDIYHAAAAADRSIAILDGDSLLRYRGRRYLSFYDASGAPQKMIAVPEALGTIPELAYDGVHAVLCGEGRIVSFGRDGEAVWQFNFPQAKAAAAWTPFLTDSGRMLCLFDGERTVYRYAIP